MKNSKILSIIILFCFSVLFSCEEDNSFDPNAEGELILSFRNTENSNIKAEAEPAVLLISLKDGIGDVIFANEEIELYKFNNEYISTVIPLTVGNYKITEYMVLDANNNVIYVTPKEGSDKAYLVDNPLEIEYTITKDQVEKIAPEVVEVGNISPEDFGYSTFGFNLVETIGFLNAVFIYDETSSNFMLTEANILIESGIETLYESTLDALTNLITVDAGYEEYKITITKTDYITYNGTFSKDSLMKHFYSPLTIILEEGKSIVLQPDAVSGKDAKVQYYSLDDAANTNYGEYEEFTANAWTNSGTEYIMRSLIDFDLSSVPTGAIIKEATLYLYTSLNTMDETGHSQLTGTNECVLQRITSSWEELTVTWNNQPTTSTTDQLEIPASTSNTQDYELDVTNFINEKIANPESSFGFMIKLQNESYYRRLRFASSDNIDSSTHPKLVIKYE